MNDSEKRLKALLNWILYGATLYQLYKALSYSSADDYDKKISLIFEMIRIMNAN